MPKHDERGHGKLRETFLRNRSDSAGQPRADLWKQGLLDYIELDVDASVIWRSIGPAPLYIESQVMWANPDGTTIPDAAFQGAGPDSGEVTDIAIDPRGTADKNLYIATNDGGIWKTADDGSTWIPTMDSMPSLSMGAVAVDPANPQIVYAGTGNPFDGGGAFTKGVGILRSIDGGQSWGIVDGGILDTIFAGMLINRIIVPAPGILLVATGNGLFRSVDGGQTAVWESLTFALNGLVFVLIGLQLPYVLAGIRSYSMKQLLVYGATFSALLIVLRLLWMYPGARFGYWFRSRVLHQDYPRPSSGGIFVLGWAGMRGVLALAAAMSLPEKLSDGSPFPQRNLIIFLTFSVILVTLVLQGLTLPWVIRRLGLAGASGPNCEAREARRIMTRAALQRLDEARAQDTPDLAPVYDDLKQHYEHRLQRLEGKSEGRNESLQQYGRALEVKRDLLRAEREAALSLRAAGRISDEVLRLIERELDLRESELTLAAESSA